jgi:hypothetical protein
MVAEKTNSPMPRTDPWTKDNEGDDEGGQPSEFVESDHNEPGSQQPPSGAAVGDAEDAD